MLINIIHINSAPRKICGINYFEEKKQKLVNITFRKDFWKYELIIMIQKSLSMPWLC